MKDKDFSKLVDIKVVEIPGNMIINGIQQTIKALALTCPSCDNVLTQFPNMSYWEVSEISTQNKDQLPKYCPNCGQKLGYDREIIDIPERTDAKV